MFSANSCSGEAEIPFCMPILASQHLAFSAFFALAVSCLPFPAKRNGGGFVVCSGSIGNGNFDNVVFGGIMITRQHRLPRNMDNLARAVILEQRITIPFGQIPLARKRPPFRESLLFREIDCVDRPNGTSCPQEQSCWRACVIRYSLP